MIIDNRNIINNNNTTRSIHLTEESTTIHDPVMTTTEASNAANEAASYYCDVYHNIPGPNAAFDPLELNMSGIYRSGGYTYWNENNGWVNQNGYRATPSGNVTTMRMDNGPGVYTGHIWWEPKEGYEDVNYVYHITLRSSFILYNVTTSTSIGQVTATMTQDSDGHGYKVTYTLPNTYGTDTMELRWRVTTRRESDSALV